jgi:Spy/CpxP family protein refolding chaperone
MKLVLKAVAIVALLAVSAGSTLSAQTPPQPAQGVSGGERQGRGPGRGAGPDVPGVSPADVQKMFDAYALVQAQEQLKISDEQFAKFLPRFKALQEARRKTQIDRMQLVVELRQLAAATPLDEAKIKDRLHALQELDARVPSELRKSYESIDQVLDLRQQAQFRAFEEMMERRKLELLSRARQANRSKPTRQ